MSKETDVINVAMKVGEQIFKVGAKGNPATIVAVGAAAAVATIGTAIGYGGYIGTQKLFGWFEDEPKQLK